MNSHELFNGCINYKLNGNFKSYCFTEKTAKEVDEIRKRLKYPEHEIVGEKIVRINKTI